MEGQLLVRQVAFSAHQAPNSETHVLCSHAGRPVRCVCTARPNQSLNPRRATASVVSLVRGTRCIIAVQAYAARRSARG